MSYAQTAEFVCTRQMLDNSPLPNHQNKTQQTLNSSHFVPLKKISKNPSESSTREEKAIVLQMKPIFKSIARN